MNGKEIVDSRLFIRLDASSSPPNNLAFAENLNNKAHLASQLLLYDTILIPTTDFGIIRSLISWLGLDIFREAIKESAIKFIRRKGILAYVGGGLGISTIAIERGTRNDWEWWQEALFSEDGTSIELQLNDINPNVSSRQKRIVIRDINRQVIHLNYDNDFFIKNIAKESYKDIINSPLLKQISIKLGGDQKIIDLEHLIEADKAQVLRQDGEINQPAELVLRVAEINMEILMAVQSGNADLLTSQGAEKLLKEKMLRIGINKSLLDSFLSLTDLNNIPDIRPAIIDNSITIQEIWKLRQTNKSKSFRKWLREVGSKDSRELEKAYVEVLGKSTLSDSLPLRGLRFAATTLSGIANPIAGLAISIADSFFLDKYLNGYSPKLFLDDLQQLTIKNRNNK